MLKNSQFPPSTVTLTRKALDTLVAGWRTENIPVKDVMKVLLPKQNVLDFKHLERLKQFSLGYNMEVEENVRVLSKALQSHHGNWQFASF